MNTGRIIDEIIETDEAKAAMRLAVRPMVENGIKHDPHEEARVAAALKARIDEVVRKHTPPAEFAAGEEITMIVL